MEPIALVQKNVCIQYAGYEHYRRVTWFEAIPPFQFLNIGAVAAGTTTPRTPAPNLEVRTDEFLQLRWWPIDTVQVRVYVPDATGRNQLRILQVPVDPTIVTTDPDLHLTEIFVWENNAPAFEAINYTAVALTQCRLKGMGFRYITEALPIAKIDAIKGGAPCTYIPATGYSGKPSKSF